MRHGPCLLFSAILVVWLIVSEAAYVFNATELEQVGERMWGPGSGFHREHGYYYHHRNNQTKKPHHHRYHGRHLQAKKKLSVAFYHIYAKGGSYRDIVQAQRTMLSNTKLYEELDNIFYNTIDDSSTSPFLIPDDPKFQNLYHFEQEGQEVYTLGMMYRFCQAYPYANVLYFHDKGSFHTNPANAMFRHVLDCHVLNPQCLRALQTGQYDTCGMRISPIPHPHYPGNFFWSTCQYMSSQLFDPWLSITNKTMIHINEEVLVDCIGTRERYFAETWVTSAVNFKPADCVDASVDSSYIYGYHFPPAFHDLCPHDVSNSQGEISKIYGSGTCEVAATWKNASSFFPAFANMKGMEQGQCSGDTRPYIHQRAQLWYGQPASMYETWMQKYYTQELDFALTDRMLVRSSNSRAIYCYLEKDGCFHNIPDWNTFVGNGFDTDQVRVVFPMQFMLLNKCRDPLTILPKLA